MVVTNWVCIKCGVINPKTYFKCQTCQQAKPIFWECATCKKKNLIANVKCSDCSRKRPAIFSNAVNMKELSDVKFSSELKGAPSVTLPSASAPPSLPLPPPTLALPPPSPVAHGLTTNSVIGSSCSATPAVGGSSIRSGMSSLSEHVSSYDIFLKLSRPSRTVKAINYVDTSEKYTLAMANCQKNNTLYVDTSFPTGYRCLYYSPRQVRPDKLIRVHWLRPKEMRQPEWTALPWCVVRDPVASDITQGVLGNCWLLSALAVLVEKPILLDRILATKTLSPYGMYRVRLYRDGKLASVIIDDQFPCTSKRLLVYSCAKRKQLFVPIIEKAMARMYGCYESLESGQTTDGLSALTGYPCRSIRTQITTNPVSQPSETKTASVRDAEVMLEPDFIWTLLLSYQEAGFLMGAGCGCTLDSQIAAEEYEQRGLLMQHAYSVMSVINADENVRLLQLRNPWGRQVWTGDWSDDSPLWTPELREQLQPVKSSDGIFWMAFSDFQRYFEKVDICKLRESWHEYRFEGYFPSSCEDTRYITLLEVHVEEAGTELEFTLFQESRRSLSLYKTPLLPIGTAIFQLKDLQRSIAGDLVDTSGYKLREFVGLDVMVDKGVYLVALYAFNHWNSTGTATTVKTGRPLRPRFVMSLFSSRFVTINCHCPAPTIMGDTLIQMATARGQKKQHDDNVISYYLLDNWSGMVVVFENRHSDNYLEVIFDANESTNLHSTRGSLLTKDTIPPMSRQLINILSHLDPSTPRYLSYQMSYSVTNESFSSHSPELGHTTALHSPRTFKQICE